MLGTVASSRRIPESAVQINCVAGSLLSGSGPGAGVLPGTVVVSGEGGVTGDGSGAAGGVIWDGDDGAGAGEDGEAGAGTEGAGWGSSDGCTQLGASITTKTRATIRMKK